MGLIALICFFLPSNYDDNKYYEYEKQLHPETVYEDNEDYEEEQKNVIPTKKTFNLEDLEKAAKLYKQKIITKEELERIKKHCL